MPCGNKLGVLLDSRPLEVRERFVEAQVRVAEAVCRLVARDQVRDQVVALVSRQGRVVVRVAVARPLRVRRVAEAEVVAVAHHRRVLLVMEAVTGVHPARVLPLAVDRVEVVVDRVVVLRAVWSRRERLVRPMTPLTLPLESGSRSPRVQEVR